MTKNGTRLEDLSSDLWGQGKSMEPMTPEEEVEAWRTTTRMLDSLCGMADGLMLEPLILALGDALHRAREEERRAEDRLTRPEGVLLGPREEERLMGLMRRSDAFSNALSAVEDEEDVNPEVKAQCLEVLEEAHEQAHEEFWRYRTEVGIPDRPTRNNARKPA